MQYEQLDEAESKALTEAVGTMLFGGDWSKSLPGGELNEWFQEFQLGLSFPNSVDVGPIGSRKRYAFLLMSNAWNISNAQALQTIARHIR